MAINRDKILREAEKLVQKGKIDQAIKEYEKLLDANPNDANTINRVGDLYGRIGQVERAIELYERIADHFTQDGFVPKAIAILKKINRLAPQRLDIFNRLAELYIQQGLLVEAKSQYQMLAEWYVRNEDNEHAIDAHRKLVQLDPSNHMAQLKLADLLMKVGQHEEAIQEYSKLGEMLIQRDKLDEAERLYRHALEQNPPSGDFLTPLCHALMESGRTPVAREFLDAALQRSPDSSMLQALEVRAQLTLGEGPKALAKAKELLAAQPDDDGVRELVGKVFLSAGESFQARDVLLPAAKRLVDRGDFTAAQTMLQDLIKAMPHDAQVLNAALRAFEPAGESEMLFSLKAALAETQFRAGEHEVARRLYVDLLQVDADNAKFRERLAQIDGGVAAPATEPEEEIEPEALEIEVEEPDVVEVDMPEEPVPAAVPEPEPEAVVEVEAPAAQAPSSEAAFDPRERLAEANVFAKYGLVDKAIAHLEEIVRNFPVDHEAREKLVTLYVEQGRVEEAAPLAGPLVEFYRESGNTAALENLVQSLPQLREEVGGETPPSQVEAPADTIEDEDVVVVEIEDDIPAEPVVAADEDVSFEIKEEPVDEALDDDFTFEIKTEPVEDDEVVVLDEVDAEVEVIEADVAEPEIEVMEPEDLAEVSAEVEDEVAADIEVAAEVEDEVAADVDVAADIEAEVAAEAAAEVSDLGSLAEVLGVEVAREATIDEQSGAYQVLDELEKSLSIPMGKPKAAAVVMPAPVETETVEPAVVEQAEPLVVEEVEPVAAEEVKAEVVETETQLEEQLVEITDSVSGPSNSELQQIDFYIGQELYEDALRVLETLEKEFPDDQEVAQRRLVLKEKGVFLDAVSAPTEEASEELFADEEDYFDLAKELEEELAEEEAMVDEATGRGQEEAELEEVFKEFQKGVAEQLSEEDSDTHFNLGIAYKEMGLLPEAIREFQISARDQGFFIESCSMIAVCYLEQGMADQAAEWYRKALESQTLSEETALALRYDLASALEMAGDAAQAAEVYEQISTADPTYRDVAQRISQLAGHSQVN